MVTRTLATLALLVLCGCAKQTVVGRYDPVHRGTYAYQKLNEGEYVVAAVSSPAMDQAMEEIGCGKHGAFICMVETDGQLYHVLQRRK